MVTTPSPFPPPIRDLDPATGECLAEIACAGPEQVQRAVAATRKAQRAWRAVPVASRVEQVQAVKEAILGRREAARASLKRARSLAPADQRSAVDELLRRLDRR